MRVHGMVVTTPSYTCLDKKPVNMTVISGLAVPATAYVSYHGLPTLFCIQVVSA